MSNAHLVPTLFAVVTGLVELSDKTEPRMNDELRLFDIEVTYKIAFYRHGRWQGGVHISRLVPDSVAWKQARRANSRIRPFAMHKDLRHCLRKALDYINSLPPERLPRR